MSEAASTRVRRKNDTWNTLYKYSHHCDADRPVSRPDCVGIVVSAYPAVALDQTNTVISPHIGRGDEHTVGLAAPLRMGERCCAQDWPDKLIWFIWFVSLAGSFGFFRSSNKPTKYTRTTKQTK